MNKISIGLDIGGTRIKGIAIDDAGQIVHQAILPTNDGNGEAWKLSVKELTEILLQQCGVENAAVGISAPGLPNDGYTAIAWMPGRLDGLEGFEWGGYLQQPTRVLNDAVAALMAEAELGAARGKKHVVMLTLGTGVGGAILIDGKPYGGAFNKAGHIGHMVIDDEGEMDITNMPGSLENCIGNCTIEKRTNGRFTSTDALLEAGRMGDREAGEIWLKSVRQLAIGLASITNIISPEMIVLGGGICAAGSDLFEPLEQFMAKYEWRAGGNKTAIVQATHGELAGAIGAACFAGKNTI